MPETPQHADALFRDLERSLKSENSSPQALHRLIAEAPFTHDREMGLLFLGFISFFVLEDDDRMVVLAGVTDNDYYHDSVRGYDFLTYDYRIPLSTKANNIAKAIRTGRPVRSSDWDTFRRPNVEKGPARLNQANSGIGYTVVHPLKGTVKGAIMFNFFQYPEFLGDAQEDFMNRYTSLVSDVLSGNKELVAV